MRVTLLGTGDSTGTPAPGCGCRTCTRARDLDVERSRYSVHVADPDAGAALLIDCSPDFRYQFLHREVSLPDAVVISHIHFDHLDGLGNAYRLFDALDVYAAGSPEPTVAAHVADRYEYLDCLSVHPRKPLEPFDVCGFEVTLVPVDHPPVPTFGLRIERDGATLAVTGDTTYGISAAARDAFRNADLLLADAIVPASFCERHPAGGAHRRPDGTPRTFGTKHLTRRGALDLADELGADRTRLVHCSHFYEPEEAFDDPLAIDGETYHL